MEAPGNGLLSKPSNFSYFCLIVERAHGIMRELDARENGRPDWEGVGTEILLVPFAHFFFRLRK